MTDETRTDSPAVEEEDFSAAAPPHPAAAGTGETSFGDAEVPAASELKIAQDQAEDYLALAQRTKADFENFRKRMARENAAATDRGMAKLAKELLPAIDHLELALKAAEGHEEAGGSGAAASPPVDILKGFADKSPVSGWVGFYENDTTLTAEYFMDAGKGTSWNSDSGLTNPLNPVNPITFVGFAHGDSSATQTMSAVAVFDG